MVLTFLVAFLMTSSGCSTVGAMHGEVVRAFAPIGRYAGHWGIDVSQPLGATVRAVAPGLVTFSGSVAGRRSVTVTLGDTIRVSYSYLASTHRGHGDRIDIGDSIGTAGMHGGVPSVHVSLRIGGAYVNPRVLFRCLGPPGQGLRLAPSPAPYPHAGVRNTRRHIRSSTCSASGGGARCI